MEQGETHKQDLSAISFHFISQVLSDINYL